MNNKHTLLSQYHALEQEFNNPDNEYAQMLFTIRQLQQQYNTKYAKQVEEIRAILTPLVDDLVQEMIDSFPNNIIWNLHMPAVDYSTFYNDYDEPTGIYDDPRKHITASYSIKFIPTDNSNFFGITGFPSTLFDITERLQYELTRKE